MTTLAGRDTAWGRGRLLSALIGALLTVSLLVAGLIFAITSALTEPTEQPEVAPGPVTQPVGPDRRAVPVDRDSIVRAPMLRVDPEAARPTAPAAVTGPTMEIPPPAGAGPAGVATGFARTPEGAVGQLGAIGTAVLQGMSVPYTNDVYTAWAMPGGVGIQRWPMTVNVQAFLEAARMGPEKDLAATVIAVPAAGQVKGVDGPDWAVACVLFDVRATITVEARMGYGYCEQMQWHEGRWMIAPGASPAPAPSTWPGSELSVRAGWRTLVDGAGE
jgi:hypothetical protein